MSHPPLAVYLHWPFCLAKCPYCDFNSHVPRGGPAAIEQARWRRALLAEIDHWAGRVPGRTVTSVFFGGGTPSLMAPATVGAALDRIAARWSAAPDVEVTLEANPTSAEAARFADFRAAGVNRISVGVQALRDDALAFLGREHSAGEARAAVALAARAAPRMSFDLIYARPGQTRAEWRAELEEALALAPEHLSLYQLGIEPGTAFRRDGVAAADEDAAADLFELTAEITAARGLPAYEISNHAAAGAECRHNLDVWRGVEYLGIGPGAHGRVALDGAAAATRAWRAPEKWLAAVERDGCGTAEHVRLSRPERGRELLLSGLRLSEGVDRARFAAAAGCAIEAVIDGGALATLTEEGLIEEDGRSIRVAPRGRLLLNAILARLIA